MFSIYFGDKKCGVACFERAGLYYRIVCKCEIPTEAHCRIQIRTGGETIDLGTCIKKGGSYVIDTKIPCKHIDPENIQITMLTNVPKATGDFVPVSSELPFAYLHKLERCRMAFVGGKVGILFTD
jgi:hypothetical protein